MSRKMTARDYKELARITLMYEMGIPNDYTGPFPQTTTCAKYQNMCYDCGEFAAQIIWKDDLRNSDTWLFAQCDTCLSEFCEDCISTDDETGIQTCNSVLRQSNCGNWE